ncbi:hypothetical protein BDV96DRAFT_581281 [Lophiotrema nucula]|uniref:Uncharacterized protein n=1 Tax=Lophiotrema nucula TaxID=690887 RepID=A0A6A5YYE2_9PLEO|nr:hypothetical protein BDV96DRAFT_581281 [Lophiotrema nucula]
MLPCQLPRVSSSKLCTPTMSSFQYSVDSIKYNSQCITFPEWVSLFTLCLAPLIAHIASGTPPVSYLTHSRPRWYDHLCHYNPTSIIWRYAAITDRRIRAIRWSRNDLAASNAIFWTAKGWDGGEDMVFAAAPHCLQCPEGTHVRIVSVTMLKTMITMLQGISALYSLIGALAGVTGIETVTLTGVDTIFFPLAILGLLRLCAATWLTEDFGYASLNDSLSKTLLQGVPSLKFNNRDIQLLDSSDALDPFLISPLQPGPWFKSSRASWPSRIFRAFYLLMLGGIWGLSFLYIMPVDGPSFFTATSFLVGSFYFLFLTISIVLYTIYFFRGQTTTTLLPCISKIWYRVYTLLIMGFMFVLIIIASVETNKGPDGLYSSSRWLGLECIQHPWWMYLVPNSQWVGLSSRREIDWAQLGGQNYSSLQVAGVSGSNTSLEERYWLYNFTGFCIGRLQDMDRQ